MSEEQPIDPGGERQRAYTALVRGLVEANNVLAGLSVQLGMGDAGVKAHRAAADARQVLLRHAPHVFMEF